MAATATGTKQRSGRKTTRSRRAQAPADGLTLPMASGEIVRLTDRGSQIVILDPPTAKLWLDSQTRNRPVKRRKVEQFSDAIRRGEWTYNGQSITFDRRGHMIDGQHRCLAVVQSNKSIPVLVVWGVDPEAQDTMDVGTARTFSDALAMRGTKSATEAATVSRHLYFFRKYAVIGGKSREAPTIIQLHPVYDESSEAIDEAVRVAQRLRKKSGLRIPTSIAAVLYLLFSEADREDADAFYDKLATGLDLAEDDAIYALRRVIIKQMSQQYAIETSHMAALMIKAFNKWRLGEPVELLSWRGGGASPERFPLIAGMPGDEA